MCDSVRKQSYLKSLKTQLLQELPPSYHFWTIQSYSFSGIRKLNFFWEDQSEETSSCIWTRIQHSIRLSDCSNNKAPKHRSTSILFNSKNRNEAGHMLEADWRTNLSRFQIHDRNVDVGFTLTERLRDSCKPLLNLAGLRNHRLCSVRHYQQWDRCPDLDSWSPVDLTKICLCNWSPFIVGPCAPGIHILLRFIGYTGVSLPPHDSIST